MNGYLFFSIRAMTNSRKNGRMMKLVFASDELVGLAAGRFWSMLRGAKEDERRETRGEGRGARDEGRGERGRIRCVLVGD
jgi:hypothetical protein